MMLTDTGNGYFISKHKVQEFVVANDKWKYFDHWLKLPSEERKVRSDISIRWWGLCGSFSNH